jgi:hypothetical protein
MEEGNTYRRRTRERVVIMEERRGKRGKGMET